MWVKLQQISLNNCRLDDTALGALTCALESYDCMLPLRVLDLSFNQITDGGCETLGRLFGVCPLLKGLNLANNLIADTGFAIFIKALRCNLEVLDLSKNFLGGSSAELLVKYAEKVGSLIKLSVSGNYFSPSSCRQLLQALRLATSVSLGPQRSKLGSREIQETAVPSLSLQPSVLLTVQCIDLTEIVIGAAGFTVLSNVLKSQSCSCRKLVLVGSLQDQASDRVGAEFILSLSHNRTLKVLDLSRCGLGYESTVAICHVLRSQKCMKSLSLHYNCFDSECLNMISSCLASFSIPKLAMAGHDFNSASVMAFWNALSESTSLKSVDISITPTRVMSKDCSFSLSRCIQLNKSLSELIIYGHNYGNAANSMYDHFHEALKRNWILQRFIGIDFFEKKDLLLRNVMTCSRMLLLGGIYRSKLHQSPLFDSNVLNLLFHTCCDDGL